MDQQTRSFLVSHQRPGSRRIGRIIFVAFSLQILAFGQTGLTAFAQAPLPGISATGGEAMTQPPTNNAVNFSTEETYSPPAAPDMLENSTAAKEATAAAAEADAKAEVQNEAAQVPMQNQAQELPPVAPQASQTPQTSQTSQIPQIPQAVQASPAAQQVQPVQQIQQVQQVQPVVAVAAPTAQDYAEWEKLEKAGEKVLWNNEYGNAERYFTKAVAKARTFPKGDSRLAKSDGQLGRLLTMRGRFAEAEPYLEEELKVKELAFGNKDGQLIPSMASLVKFYLLYGTNTKADPLTEKILAYVEGRLSDAGGDTSATKYKKGQPLQGWAGEAAPVMRNPVIEWAIACDDIGNLYSSRSSLPENFALADRLFKAALDVKATVLGKHHLSLANSYDSLGGLSLLRKHDEEAESYFKDALEITQKILPNSNYQVYNRLDKLARCQILLGKFDEAEALYRKAQGFWNGEPSNNGNEARAAYSLGSLLAQEKKYDQAAPILAKALSAQEQNIGPDSFALVPYLEKYAYVLYYLGDKPQSDQLKARAHVIAPPAPPLEPTLTMKAKAMDQ